jgi:hypothetical protein
MPGFIKEHFGSFVRAVALAPEESRAAPEAAVPGGGTIKLDYVPARRPNNHEGGHLSFDVPYSRTRNPVYNVLKAKKEQLAGSGFTGLQGVILCDGDCSILTRNRSNPSGYTLEEIIRNFLRQNSSIGFVLTVGVVSENAGFSSRRWVTKVKPRLFTQAAMGPGQTEILTRVLMTALQEIPTPKRTPLNAKFLLEKGNPPPVRFSDGFGRWSFTMANSMQTTEITISARALTALLGGEIDLATFRSLHLLPSNKGAPPLAPLQRAIADGRRLESISLKKQDGKDDDMVTFCFGPSDPARVKFRVPNKECP